MKCCLKTENGCLKILTKHPLINFWKKKKKSILEKPTKPYFD